MTEKAYLKTQISDWNGWKIIQLNIKYRNTKVKNGTVRVTLHVGQENTILNGLVSNMKYCLKKKFGVVFFSLHCKDLYSPFPNTLLPFLPETYLIPENLQNRGQKRQNVLHFRRQK